MGPFNRLLNRFLLILTLFFHVRGLRCQSRIDGEPPEPLLILCPPWRHPNEVLCPGHPSLCHCSSSRLLKGRRQPIPNPGTKPPQETQQDPTPGQVDHHRGKREGPDETPPRNSRIPEEVGDHGVMPSSFSPLKTRRCSPQSRNETTPLSFEKSYLQSGPQCSEEEKNGRLFSGNAELGQRQKQK